METNDMTGAKPTAGVVMGLVAIAVFSFVLIQYLDARWYAVHSYVASACHAVERFHEENGRFPQSLDEIDKSKLDYDLGIPLSQLNYSVTDTGYRVSYDPYFGQAVSCP